MTPEEYETLVLCGNYFKRHFTFYTTIFLFVGGGFTYWQRMYLPRGFFVFTGFMAMFSGAFYAAIMTGKYSIQKVDMLGSEYELSRLIKQDIFDTRPDVDADIRALYYMEQAKRNDEAKENFEKKFNRYQK